MNPANTWRTGRLRGPLPSRCLAWLGSFVWNIGVFTSFRREAKSMIYVPRQPSLCNSIPLSSRSQSLHIFASLIFCLNTENCQTLAPFRTSLSCQLSAVIVAEVLLQRALEGTILDKAMPACEGCFPVCWYIVTQVNHSQSDGCAGLHVARTVSYQRK